MMHRWRSCWMSMTWRQCTQLHLGQSLRSILTSVFRLGWVGSFPNFLQFWS
jgi:hypothetical protein